MVCDVVSACSQVFSLTSLTNDHTKWDHVTPDDGTACANYRQYEHSDQSTTHPRQVASIEPPPSVLLGRNLESRSVIFCVALSDQNYIPMISTVGSLPSLYSDSISRLSFQFFLPGLPPCCTPSGRRCPVVSSYPLSSCIAVNSVNAFHCPSFESLHSLTIPRPLPTSVSSVKNEEMPWTSPTKSIGAMVGLRRALESSTERERRRHFLGWEDRNDAIVSVFLSVSINHPPSDKPTNL